MRGGVNSCGLTLFRSLLVLCVDSGQSQSSPISVPRYDITKCRGKKNARGWILMHSNIIFLQSITLIALPFSVSCSMTSSWGPLGQQTLHALRLAKTFLKWPHLIGPAPPPGPGCGYRSNKTSGKDLGDQTERGMMKTPRMRAALKTGASVHASCSEASM